jgi:tetratricopeptide (TPR) repeat protein
MPVLSLKKVSYWINYAQYRVGAWLFPLLEPLCRFVEDLHPEVRKHCRQALIALEKNRLPIALLNLNRVLSLRPNHFLARIHRGRIYIREGRFRLASEDYLQANQISRYRFIHYDLYQEYLRSVNRGAEDTAPIAQNFSQTLDALRQAHEKLLREGEVPRESESFEEIAFLESEGEVAGNEVLQGLPEPYSALTDEEQGKFAAMGPITPQEVQQTDWGKLIKQLTS